MRAALTHRWELCRIRPALAVALAIAAVALPRELVWCTTPTGHGSLENLLLGHCSESRPDPGCEAAGGDLSASLPHGCDHGCRDACTDIPVPYPLEAFGSSGLTAADSMVSIEPVPPDQGVLLPAATGFLDPPPAQSRECLAATVLIC